MSKKEFLETVELLGPNVSDNVEIIEPKELKVPLLFRVDEEVPKLFIPRMPKSAAVTENSTVPRIVTATTLLGCINGHANMLNWVLGQRPENTPSNFFKISGFEFDYALLPNNKLVYDAKDTREAWLITYNKETISWKSIPYGEMFFHRLDVTVLGNSPINKIMGDILLKVDGELGFPVAEGMILEKGHYLLKINLTTYALPGAKHLPKRMNYKDSHLIELTPISANVYKSFKDISVQKR